MHFLLKKSVPIIICFGLLTCSLGYAPIDKALLERMTLPQLEKLLNEARRLKKQDIIKQVEPRIAFLRARASRPSENMEGEGQWVWQAKQAEKGEWRWVPEGMQVGPKGELIPVGTPFPTPTQTPTPPPPAPVSSGRSKEPTASLDLQIVDEDQAHMAMLSLLSRVATMPQANLTYLIAALDFLEANITPETDQLQRIKNALIEIKKQLTDPSQTIDAADIVERLKEILNPDQLPQKVATQLLIRVRKKSNKH
jgi:hypothetical protein